MTEQILNFLSELDEIIDLPKSFNQLLYWDKHQYYKARARITTEERLNRKRIKECLYRLKKAEILSFQDNMNRYQLTAQGWLKYLYYKTKHKSKYRATEKEGSTTYVIIFDIPEEHRRFRESLRLCLHNLDFKLFQKSVFLTKNEKNFMWVQKIVANCRLDDYVKFIEARKIY